MPKDMCPSCKKEKDTRAKLCRKCTPCPRLGTGKGWVITKSGYITGCFNGVYKQQHRYVMEEALGRKLLSTEHIHHIDGNSLNNNLSNLEIVDTHVHHKKHMTSEKAKIMSILGHKKRWGNK